MPEDGFLPNYQKGQGLKASGLNLTNRKVDKLERRLNQLLKKTENLHVPPIARARFLAYITNTGPETDGPTPATYTDARYFVRKLSPLQQTDDTDLLAAQLEPIEDFQRWETATNLAEATYVDGSGISGGGHALKAGTIVEVFLFYLDTERATKFWCFNAPVGDVFTVTVRKDGGVAGDIGTNCTFTYSINADAGTPIATGVTPLRPRFPTCEYNVPTDDSIGLARYDDDGNFELLLVLEEEPVTDLVTYVTATRVDGATQKFQEKTQQALVLELGTESAWTDTHVGGACP